MSKDQIKSELIQRIVDSWLSTVIGLTITIVMLVLASKKVVQWETAYGWVTYGVTLIAKKKDSLKSISK